MKGNKLKGLQMGHRLLIRKVTDAAFIREKK
jgi:hypothetical protein